MWLSRRQLRSLPSIDMSTPTLQHPAPAEASSTPRDVAGRLASLPAGRVTKWVTLAFWLVVAVLAFGPSAGLTGAQKNDASAWLPEGAESTQVIEAVKAFQTQQLVPFVVVYERATGTTPADTVAVQQQVTAFGALPGISGAVTGPLRAADGQALQVVVPIAMGAGGWDSVQPTGERIRELMAGAPAGLTPYLTGPGGAAMDQSAAFEGIDGKLLYSALAVVILILLVTYRSPVLWLLPVISAVVGLVSAQAVVYLLATHLGLTVNAQSAGILTVLVFGAATDYALLLVARYREELRRHEDRHEAMALALHRSGPAILASGATVILGTLCLLAGTLNSTKGLGPVAAVGIAVGLAVMLTLLPALLVICGRWVFWPVRPTYGSVDHTAGGFWAKVGARIARAPRRTWVVTTMVLLVAGLGVLQLNATGLSRADAFYTTPDSVVGEQVMSRHFAGGEGSPVLVVSSASTAERVRTATADTPGIASVTTPVVVGSRALMQATLTDAPDSPQARSTVDLVRDAIHAVPGAQAIAGGDTALDRDTMAASDRENLVIIPLILAVVFLVLMVLLRSLVAPVVLVATIVVSYVAALGLSALIFRHVLGFAGADPSLPLFTFVFLVALGIDYNIFLMTRIREETARVGTRQGALTGLATTGGVITSAGLVLAGTFAVLGTLPLVTFAEIGIVVALGVLLDALIVRSVMVTALTLDLGDRMWWPSRLSRRA